MKYEVLFLNDDGSQNRFASYDRFPDAQRFRDELTAQGYEAWIEEDDGLSFRGAYSESLGRWRQSYFPQNHSTSRTKTQV